MITKIIKRAFSTHKYINLRQSAGKVDEINKKLLEMLKTQTNPGMRITIAEMFKVSHRISSLQEELDNQPVFQELYEYLRGEGYRMYFEGLMMHVSRPTQYYGHSYLVELRLKGQSFQTRDDPESRQSLYFKDIKDFDEHIEITRYDENVEEHVKQIQKKSIQSALIDKENPLGFPQVSALRINLKISEGQQCIEGILKYNLGKIRVMSLNSPRELSDSSKKQITKLRTFPQPVLRGVKDFIEDLVPSEDIESMVTLSKILNQVSMIEQLKRLHQLISHQLLGMPQSQL